VARVRFASLDDNRCSITWRDGTVTTYWAPDFGGYVRDISRHPGTLGQQVGDGLAHSGNMLMWRGPRPLVDLIRREYRALRREEARRASEEGYAFTREDHYAANRCARAEVL
jgi:hypothetical protein